MCATRLTRITAKKIIASCFFSKHERIGIPTVSSCVLVDFHFIRLWCRRQGTGAEFLLYYYYYIFFCLVLDVWSIEGNNCNDGENMGREPFGVYV